MMNSGSMILRVVGDRDVKAYGRAKLLLSRRPRDDRTQIPITIEVQVFNRLSSPGL